MDPETEGRGTEEEATDDNWISVPVLHGAFSQRITSFAACLTGPGPKLRLDCRYQNITNNPLRYEITVQRGPEPQIIRSTLKPNYFSEKYHNRASMHIERGLVQLHLERYNISDLGLYTCTLNIQHDLVDRQSKTLNVQKDNVERCAGISTFNIASSWPLVLLLSLPLLQAGGFLYL
ncbi:thy-1 membrane glycoprotein [Bombina bombina]|uniref:thy-1 membrane glycoprotein n=1 Tax=Bombina bombina TaxID=8345 RepID=UPI00235A6E15|nr:thy-1 membrane glycoprotein [Bombina bombina]